jgi:hypothetical protein
MIRSKLVTWLRGACRPTEPNCSSRFGGSNESDRNSDAPNDVYLGIAALAKACRIPAVLTTNFDRALEAAFRKLDVPYDVNSHAAQFQTLADRFRKGGPDGPRPILKLHGSAEDPATLVDTLSQRKRGFPPEVADCVRHLLRYGHRLFLLMTSALGRGRKFYRILGIE